MIRVKIESDQVVTRQGKKGAYYKQTGWAFLTGRDGALDPYPSKIEFMLSKDERDVPVSYSPGDYIVHPSSVRVGRFGDLEIGFMNLVPAPTKK